MILASTPLTGLINHLVNAKFLSENDGILYRDNAAKNNTPLISYLVENNHLAAKKIANVAQNKSSYNFVDLDTIAAKDLPTNLIDKQLLAKHRVLPLFQRDKKISVAISDPFDTDTINAVTKNATTPCEIVIVEEDKLGKMIEIVLGGADFNLNSLGGQFNRLVKRAQLSDNDEVSIVDFADKIIADATDKNASDIHLEPFEKIFRIRFRIDGVLYKVASLPSAIASKVISRFKVLAQINIAERRVPQDGHFSIRGNRDYDFRVNTCPTLFGEKMVIRILDPSTSRIKIDELGMEQSQQQTFLDAIHRPHGMVLVTGTTGSGKTVSLYAALDVLNHNKRNISTAEDPVEITVDGINQVNINTKAGLDFALALKAFLRQDPDVIMLGEIRDLETANIAVKAAQTGHLLLSTLHTNDAPQTINRLLQMGVKPFNIISAVHLIIAQRLVRKLCPHCKTPSQHPPKIYVDAGFSEQQIKTMKAYSPNGCGLCYEGYKGRVGIYQMLTMSDAMRKIILDGGNALEIAKLAQTEGIIDLKTAGFLKVAQGITSLEEISAIT